MQSDNNKSLKNSINGIVQAVISTAIISIMVFQINASKNIAVMDTKISMIKTSLEEMKSSQKEELTLVHEVARDQDKLKIEVSNLKERVSILESAN